MHGPNNLAKTLFLVCGCAFLASISNVAIMQLWQCERVYWRRICNCLLRLISSKLYTLLQHFMLVLPWFVIQEHASENHTPWWLLKKRKRICLCETLLLFCLTMIILCDLQFSSFLVYLYLNQFWLCPSWLLSKCYYSLTTRVEESHADNNYFISFGE